MKKPLIKNAMEIRKKFSHYIGQVMHAQQEIIVLRKGKVAAKIIPISEEESKKVLLGRKEEG